MPFDVSSFRLLLRSRTIFGDLSRKRGIYPKETDNHADMRRNLQKHFPEELTQLIIDCWEDIIKEPGELLFCSVDDLIFGLKHIRLFKNQNS